MSKTIPTLPGIIDSHAHITMDPLSGDRDGVLQRAREAGVSHMLTIGTTLEESRQALATARAIPEVSCTVGVHPHDVETLADGDLDAIRALAAAPEVVAIGEIGLDFYYEHSPREIQKDWFRRQMGLAAELNLPVVLHSREAEAETEAILREFPSVSGVLHCFSSGPELARAGLELGYYISFSGIVTFNKADEVRAVAAEVPLERMLVETDCPYLTPAPFRGKTNEPAYVTLVARKIAEIKGVPVEQVVEATSANTRKLFGLA